MRTKTQFGLEPQDLENIRSVFMEDQKADSVILFGSRAMETNHPGSDIDLAVRGPNLKPEDLNKFRQKLEELHLPWFIDLVHYNMVSDLALKDHIQRVGVEIYSRKSDT
jgi:predicted nucleotidyltransferase